MIHVGGMAVHIVGELTARSDRIAVLQKQIKWIEEHYYQYPHRPYGNSNKDNNNNVKQLKQELPDLLEEDNKRISSEPAQ